LNEAAYNDLSAISGSDLRKVMVALAIGLLVVSTS
jgi:hypothetical protein